MPLPTSQCPQHPTYDGSTGAPNCRCCRKHRRAYKRFHPETATAQPQPKTPTSSFSESKDTAELQTTVSEEVKSLEDLVRVCKIDTGMWEVERYLCNKWDFAGEPHFQVKAWLRRKVALVAVHRELESLKDQAKQLKLAPTRLARTRAYVSGNLLEINIPDLHVGKLAWSAETGYSNYDGKLAKQVFEEAVDSLLERSASLRYERVVFVVGNDLLHSDTKQGTTTAGTPLDNDSRFQRSFTLARQLTVHAIERFRGIAPVDVVMCPGNHDQLSVWHLGDSLESFYHSAEDVKIDNSPALRKYYQWGKCMFLFAHGNKGKLADYPLLMATEQPKMFGATLWREAHTGDKHQLKVSEHHGVRVRILPALCPPDAWHTEHAFVGMQRSAEAFMWHREEGLIGTAVYSVAEPRDTLSLGSAA